jgi:hypothetical protein
MRQKRGDARSACDLRSGQPINLIVISALKVSLLTTWTVKKGNHKSTRYDASVCNSKKNL